jgi:hypothetical protein
MKKIKTANGRKMYGVSMSVAEQETVTILMKSGGYDNFSQFAKSRIFKVASEAEQRLHEVELGLGNVVTAIERQHKRWVEMAKLNNENDLAPLMAAALYLQMLGSSPQDRAEVTRYIDMKLIEETMKEKDHVYSAL